MATARTRRQLGSCLAPLALAAALLAVGFATSIADSLSRSRPISIDGECPVAEAEAYLRDHARRYDAAYAPDSSMASMELPGDSYFSPRDVKVNAARRARAEAATAEVPACLEDLRRVELQFHDDVLEIIRAIETGRPIRNRTWDRALAVFRISVGSTYHSMTSADTIFALTELRYRHGQRLRPARIALAAKLGIEDLPWPTAGLP